MSCKLERHHHASAWKTEIPCQGVGEVFLGSQEKAVVLGQKTR